ncbi:MAG: serine--tRNA ligase [Clostridia bacterium]
MIDINLIRKNPEFVVESLKKKGYSADFTEFFQLDGERKALMVKVEGLKAERNKVSADIPKRKKNNEDVEQIFAQMREIGDQITEGDNAINDINAKIDSVLMYLPNLPDEDLLAGDKENNAVVGVYGKMPIFDFPIKHHVDLCNDLGLIDYERGVKLSGGGYWLYRNIGAQLEWALLNFFISQHIKDGYEFILPPHQLSYNCGYGSGQFPKFLDEVYWLDEQEDKKKNHFMLPTAETALVNIYSGEILKESDLPKKMFAYTPCYRKEAGSYRAEERGMIRGHQFNKIEMVQYTTPEQSKGAFTELVNKAASLVEQLGLHFRISKLAAGDCSASMARTYDIEVWIPSMGIYKEVSSVSNASDYQARRNNTKYRESISGKTKYVHTLNGSGLATSRIIPAIVEQYQNADGSVRVPQVLQAFMGGLEVIKKG